MLLGTQVCNTISGSHAINDSAPPSIIKAPEQSSAQVKLDQLYRMCATLRSSLTDSRLEKVAKGCTRVHPIDCLAATDMDPEKSCREERMSCVGHGSTGSTYLLPGASNMAMMR